MMNTRFCTVVTVVMLVTLSTGCSGMKNFLFGRGARCGLCSKLGSRLPTPSFGNVLQAPLAAPVCPTAVCPTAPAPVYSAAPSCGCNEFAGVNHGHGTYSSGTCGSCGDSHAGFGGDVSYGPGSHGTGFGDPYANQFSGNTLVPGQQINGETVVGVGPVQGTPGFPSGTSFPATPSYNGAPIQSDNFQSRKFDTDGNKILWEEPLSAGTKAL